MKRFLSFAVVLSVLALPPAASASAPLPAEVPADFVPAAAQRPPAPLLSRDERTGQTVIVGGTMISVPTMLWGFAGWAAADSLAAAAVGGAVFFGGLGLLAVTAGCALDPSLCGHVLNAGYDAVVGVADRIAGVFDRLAHGPASACLSK